MSFDYIIEKEHAVQLLTKEQEESLVKKISSDFVSLNSERSVNLEMASKLANEIFFKNDFKSISDKNKKWKTKVKMCKTFMFYQTLKAFIWRNTYANVNSMFDVSGENHDSNNISNKQKAMLVDIFEKMEYQKTCDKRNNEHSNIRQCPRTQHCLIENIFKSSLNIHTFITIIKFILLNTFDKNLHQQS